MSKTPKSIPLAAVFSLAASGLALAADIGVKAPLPAPAPVYNWTGFYVGGNAGVSLGTFKTDFNGAPGAFTVLNAAGSLTSTIPGFGGTDVLYPGGFIGGGQIGFNWQFSPLWVVGVEGDFQGADEKASTSFSNNVSFLAAVPGNVPVPNSATVVTNYGTKIEWFGTARLRAGYLFGDGAVLTYVTGGLAFGKVDIEETSAFSTSGGNVTFGSSQAFGHSNTNTGWVVGTGTEGKLVNFPGWIYRLEGLYMDLGHLDATGPGSSSHFTGEGFLLTANVGPVHTHTHFTDTILRAGLSYQFH